MEKLKGLFRVSNFNITKSGKGAIVSVGYFNENSEEWKNANVYVPLEAYATQKESERCFARVGKDKKGRKYLSICVRIEHTFDNEEDENEEEEKPTKKKNGEKKANPEDFDDDGDISF